MTGIVTLIGGGEHTPGCEAIDRMLLREAGVQRAEVAVILAASPRRRQAFKRNEAEQWWARFGARARCAFAGESRPVERAATLIAEADIVVLTGGRPWLLRQRLDAGLGALVRERWLAGTPIVGSSAGAMALGGAFWSLRPSAPLALCPGLDLVNGAVTAPHAGRHGINYWAALTQRAHPEVEVLGIPDRTAVVVRPGGDRAVVGEGEVLNFAREPYREWSSSPRTYAA